MWACGYCGQEYEKLFDARWNCPCRKAPDAARFRRTRALWGLYLLATRTLFGVALGLVMVFLEFELGWGGLFLEWDAGGQIGLFVGLAWGFLAWRGLPEPIYTRPGVNPQAFHVEFLEDKLTVDLADGRTIIVPLPWYPRLLNGSPSERQNWKLLEDGRAIEWPDLDEEISMEGLLAGRRGGESEESLKKWLATRPQASTEDRIQSSRIG
jgi:hypothetical protein